MSLTTSFWAMSGFYFRQSLRMTNNECWSNLHFVSRVIVWKIIVLLISWSWSTLRLCLISVLESLVRNLSQDTLFTLECDGRKYRKKLWPVTRSFDVFFDLRLNKRLSKQSWGRWFETPSHILWRHCNVMSQIWMNVCESTRWSL